MIRDMTVERREAPDLEDLTLRQREHVLRVFPETRATMAEYLRSGTTVVVLRQDEVPEAPPFALAVKDSPHYWTECLDSEADAVAFAGAMGLTVGDAC